MLGTMVSDNVIMYKRMLLPDSAMSYNLEYLITSFKLDITYLNSNFVEVTMMIASTVNKLRRCSSENFLEK